MGIISCTLIWGQKTTIYHGENKRQCINLKLHLLNNIVKNVVIMLLRVTNKLHVIFKEDNNNYQLASCVDTS